MSCDTVLLTLEFHIFALWTRWSRHSEENDKESRTIFAD